MSMVCGMARKSDAREGRPGHTTVNAVICCCLATLESAERLGLEQLMRELCAPCREAFQLLAARNRS